MRGARARSSRSAPEADDRPVAPVQVVCGPLLCDLRFWSEAEWASLPGPDRPAHRVHLPGLGWAGAVPTRGLN